MRAVRLHAIRDLRTEDVAAPSPPGAGEVTLTVTVAGICGSDLHNYATGQWITRAPSVAGHEFTGVVTKTGAGVAHVVPGDRVLVDSRYVCGDCPACRDGRAQVCEHLGFLGEAIDGGFAEAVTLPARNVMRAPDGVPDRHLALAEPLAVALHVLNRLGAEDGTEIVVAGCGAIGGLVAILAARRGHPVVVADRNAARAALVADLTGGRVIDLGSGLSGGEAPRFGVDATGSPGVIGALLGGLAGGGALALVGIGDGSLPVMPVMLVEKEISLVGCHAFADELAEVARILPSQGDVLDGVIAEEVGLDAVPESYERHLAGVVSGLKTLIRCREVTADG